ncbi:DUF4397 domain-containing protein [Halorussus salinus]|uniref:DUF4397 domain-containing protein n=1 Tax=Halorussus salinus TaxID=1364935 RepID=UPI0010922F2B|nr:DUF4397 domain-containing protein [Halorussus salinus]
MAACSMWGNQTTVTRRLATLGVALLVMTSFAGIGIAAIGANNAQDEDAQVRVAHLSPDAPAVDVLVDGQAALEGVEFGAVSDYLALSAGEHTVTIQTSENETVVFEGNVSVEAGEMYTVAAIGEVTEETFEPVVYEDDFEMPSDENATVRLIHASPDAPAVDVTVAGTDTVLYDNVSFGNASDYVEVPAGDYELEIRGATEENDGEVVTTVNVSVEGGTAYSAIAAGYLSPDDEPADTPFEVLLATDSSGEMMGTETEMDGTETEMMGNETTTEEM